MSGMDRRRFLGVLAAGAAAAVLPRGSAAQQAGNRIGASNMPMDEDRYHPVRLAPKSATPSMTAAQRDELEHHIHCMCGCNLDVYTCRTTDFSCEVSPKMHQDVMALVAGGYGAQEILNAFVGTYGERVLMEPKKEGFNIAGYVVPFAALGGGTALVLALLRRWQRPAAAPAPVEQLPVNATPEEMERLQTLLRRDDR